MSRIFVTLLMILCLISCKKEEVVTDITRDCQFTGLLRSCFSADNYRIDELICQSNIQYRTYENLIRSHLETRNCDTARLPDIDFNKFTLLSKRTAGGGCGVKTERTILKDTGNRKIIYKITNDYTGKCYLYLFSYNYAIVPKIPVGFTVEFQVTQRHDGVLIND
jgi:hypothetical protein